MSTNLVHINVMFGNFGNAKELEGANRYQLVLGIGDKLEDAINALKSHVRPQQVDGELHALAFHTARADLLGGTCIKRFHLSFG